MLIEDLIIDPSVSRFTGDNGVVYGIRVLGRGESLFFQENERGLICAFDAIKSVLYTKSIKQWGEDEKMSLAEKGRVISEICSAYEKIFKKKIVVSDARP